jgi:hypothetical protein
MFIKGNRDNFYEILSKHKKFVWIFHFSENILEIDTTVKEILPSWYIIQEKGRSHKLNLLMESVSEDIVVVESIAENEVDLLMELGIDTDWLFHTENFKPIRLVIITFENGWVKSTSEDKCYCLNTLVEFLVELYPEKFTEFI